MEDTTGMPVEQQIATHLRGIDSSLERLANAVQGTRNAEGIPTLLKLIAGTMTQLVAKRTI